MRLGEIIFNYFTCPPLDITLVRSSRCSAVRGACGAVEMMDVFGCNLKYIQIIQTRFRQVHINFI